MDRVNTFIDSFIYFWRNYFRFSGRATRSQFWWNQLWYYAVITLYAISMDWFGQSEFIYMLGSFMAIFVTVTFLPKFALSIRRYRDIGFSNVSLWIYTLFVFTLNFLAGIISWRIGHILIYINNFVTVIMFLLALLPSDYLTGRRPVIFLRQSLKGEKD